MKLHKHLCRLHSSLYADSYTAACDDSVGYAWSWLSALSKHVQWLMSREPGLLHDLSRLALVAWPFCAPVHFIFSFFWRGLWVIKPNLLRVLCNMSKKFKVIQTMAQACHENILRLIAEELDWARRLLEFGANDNSAVSGSSSTSSNCENPSGSYSSST